MQNHGCGLDLNLLISGIAEAKEFSIICSSHFTHSKAKTTPHPHTLRPTLSAFFVGCFQLSTRSIPDCCEYLPCALFVQTKRAATSDRCCGPFVVFWKLALQSHTYFIVGIENSAPSLMPDGQRLVTVFVRVQNLMESVPCWFRSPKEDCFQPPNEW